MSLFRLTLILAASLPCAAFAQSSVERVPLPDSDLAVLRGGFALPGGGDLTIGVVTDTFLNGTQVVRSAYSIDRGVPTVAVSGRVGADGLSDLQLADGGSATTIDGRVSVIRSSDGARIEFSGDRLNVTALAGRALGTIVANSANDRAIDVVTNVNIGLSGVATGSLGSSLSRVSTLALDATTRLSR